nr:radial spoke head protein 6 homolog A [Halyomorpha halys]
MSISSFTTAVSSYKSGLSYRTRLSGQLKSGEDQHGEELGEESQSEESSVICEKERVAEIKDPTPKQILGMFQWNGESLYDHLKKLIDELISTRPDNVIAYFDQYSRNMRFVKPPMDPLLLLPNAVKLGKMYGLIYPTADEEKVLKPKITFPWDFVYYFEEMGICLPREELYQISLALRKLALIEGLSKIRFWGKIFGLERSYIVAECEMTHDEIEHRRDMEREEMSEEEEEEEEEESIFSNVDEPLGLSGIFKKKGKIDFGVEEEEEGEEEDLIKHPVYKKLDRYVRPAVLRPAKIKPPKTVPEKTGEGVNKKAYYVCHEAGDEWTPLPNAKPEDIVVARKIRKYFKGFLLSKVESYPPFNGMERDLLRAQIARITAGTHISPLGYYQFGGGEEAENLGEEVPEGEIVANLDYEAIPPQDLLKTEFWVHHTPHILRIGRTTYYKELKMNEEEMEEELHVSVDKNKEEVGPPLLTPLSEDVSMEMIQPWVIKTTSLLLPAAGVIAVRSNLWPGAYAFGKERVFENIYIGWGFKLVTEGFNPHYLPTPQLEYEIGPEIMEMTDPTPEMEEEWREANKPRPIIHTGEDEGEGGPYEEEPEN